MFFPRSMRKYLCRERGLRPGGRLPFLQHLAAHQDLTPGRSPLNSFIKWWPGTRSSPGNQPPDFVNGIPFLTPQNSLKASRGYLVIPGSPGERGGLTNRRSQRRAWPVFLAEVGALLRRWSWTDSWFD